MISEHFFFYLGISFLSMHEMDAIRCKEWQIFPGLSKLNDKLGFLVFLFAHISIFFFIYWQLTFSEDIESFMKKFDLFMVIHLGLHILFLRHPKNQFKDWISWVIITGAGFCGLLDFIIYTVN